MAVRAEQVAATREAVLDAAVDLFWEQPTDDLSLPLIAERAGVSVQTVLRHFGSKDGVLQAAMTRETGRVGDERDPSAVGDVRGAVAQLCAHYELRARHVLRLLAEEAQRPSLRPLVDPGREMHRAWCAAVFADALAGLSEADRRRRLAQLVAICDVYTWKLLRLDAGLDADETQSALVEMLTPLLEVR